MRDPITAHRVAQLHPKYRAVFEEFIDDIENSFNTTFRVAQGFRTFEEQQALYDQPKHGLPRVTNAPAGKSFHNYGIAVDIVEMINGKPNWGFKYSTLVPYASKYGLTWGGSWPGTLKDLDHFQVQGYNIGALYNKYEEKDFIPGTEYLNL
jgi:hypothetical protein